MDAFVQGILCLTETFLGGLFKLINEAIGGFFGFELTPLDLGCDS